MTASINTVRGEAMHDVVRYALWLMRQSGAAGTSHQGMRAMPEVAKKLGEHLVDDPSPAIRAVYGQWFPWLNNLDNEWGSTNAALIFGDITTRLGAASWNAYLLYSRLYSDAFKALRPTYLQALNLLVTTQRTAMNEVRSATRFGEHLLMLTGWGAIGWGDSDGLLRDFLTNAGTTTVAHSLEFVGRSLREYRDKTPPETLMRFRETWSHVVQICDIEPARADVLKPFGWWFASGAFDEAWSLERLEQALERAGDIDVDYLVVEELVKLAPTFPLECLRVLKKLVRRKTKNWLMSYRDQQLSAILRATLNDVRTSEQARELVHELGAHGMLELRHLLHTRDASASGG
jgi:hypothetical protein